MQSDPTKTKRHKTEFSRSNLLDNLLAVAGSRLRLGHLDGRVWKRGRRPDSQVRTGAQPWGFLGFFLTEYNLHCPQPTPEFVLPRPASRLTDCQAADSDWSRGHTHRRSMIKSSLPTMETIHESRHKTNGMLPEAALFSVVRPNQWTTDVVVSAAMDGLAGRSSSLKMPLTRKASFRVREWVKRSNSTR